MARRFQRRLSMAMCLLTVATIAIMALLILSTVIDNILNHYNEMAVRATLLAGQHIEYALAPETLPHNNRSGYEKNHAARARLQSLADRILRDLQVKRVVVVDAKGSVLASAGLITAPEYAVERARLIRFAKGFLNKKDKKYYVHKFGSDVGVATGLRVLSYPEPLALVILHQIEGGFGLVRKAIVYIAILSAVMMALTILVSIALSRGFARPIKKLAAGVRKFGQGDLDHRVYLSSNDEIEGLALAFNEMAISLKDHMERLEKETQRRERFESELRIAAQLQQALLPTSAPQVKGLAVMGWSTPATEVGGDFYDYLDMGSGKWGIVIGDATGKGLSAALLITECWSILKTLADDIDSPKELLRKLNKALCGRTGETGRFVTLFLGVVDMNEGVLRYSGAGHNPPILVGASPDRRLQLTSNAGYPLGIIEDSEYEDTTIPLERSDTILLYTDGLTEAYDPEFSLYGESRLEELLVSRVSCPLPELLGVISSDVRKHIGGGETYDDMTMVVMRYEANARVVAQGLCY